MPGLFLGYKNKNEGFFGVVKKVLRFFLGGWGYVKKVVIFLCRQVLKL